MTRSDVPGMTRVYLGHDGYREFAESWRETLVPSQVEVIETRALGDGRLYALLRQTAIGPGSGVALDFDYVQINEFESGKICRAEVFTDLDKGRRAAGLD
jgi:hypothetical protein